ncbi:hypothetical protein ACFWNL_17435 [Kitasatospora sp. NPDC058397]|uniref:hypothetical protein n=1 Tax=unclassified Kitasatospora TaxID=2633591 RepID=UPI00364A90A8
MAGVGRPQGRLKGETEQADALARFVREVTSGVTVRELARRYPAGKTSWSEYRSGEKDIPWHLLQRLVHDRVTDPRARTVLLERAARLHEQATLAARGLRPPEAGRFAAQQALDLARQAQRQAEEGVAEADELIRVLVEVVAELRGELGDDAEDDTGPASQQAPGGGAAQLRRARLREATRCLAEVRRIRQSAREAQQAAQREQDAVGLLADQERTHARADEGRADEGREPGSELVVADGVQAHLPVLWRLDADLLAVREALADRRREVLGVTSVVPRSPVPRIVRGEVVDAPDNRLTGLIAPFGRARNTPHAAGAPSTAGTRRRTGTILFAALALLLVGVLLGMHFSAPAPGIPVPYLADSYRVPAVTEAHGPSPSPSAAGTSADTYRPAAGIASATASAPASADATAAPGPQQAAASPSAPLSVEVTPTPGSAPAPADATPAPEASSTPRNRDTQGVPPDTAPQQPGQPVVVASAPGTLYSIAPDHRAVYQWQGRDMAWTPIGGPTERILAGGAGVFAVSADDKRLLGYSGTPGNWTPVSEPGADFAISGTRLYRLAQDHTGVYRWNGTGTSWTKIGGPAGRLYGGGAGLFATDPRDGRIFRYDTARESWTYVGTDGAAFAVSDTHLYGLSPDRSQVFQWDGTGSDWTLIGGHAQDLYAGPADLFATSPDHGTFLRYARTPQFWDPVSEAGAEFAVTADHIYRLAPDHSAIYQAPSNGAATWTKISGPAATLITSR